MLHIGRHGCKGRVFVRLPLSLSSPSLHDLPQYFVVPQIWHIDCLTTCITDFFLCCFVVPFVGLFCWVFTIVQQTKYKSLHNNIIVQGLKTY